MLKQLAGFFFAVTALGADLTGIWTGQMPDRSGSQQDLSFRFSENRGVLSGKMYGDNESTPLTDAKRTGDQITFSVVNELNGQISRFVYLGTIRGDEIDLIRERVAPKPEPSKADAKPEPKPRLHLKRLA